MPATLARIAVLVLAVGFWLPAQAGDGPGRTLDPDRRAALLAKIGFSASPDFAPDGKRIAFVADISGLPQVWTVPVESGWPARVTELADPVDSVLWSPAGDWFAFSLSPGGGGNHQIYLIHPDGTRLRRITQGRMNLLGHWSPDGRLLTFASNRRKASEIDLYTYEVARRRLRLRVRDVGAGRFTGISRDGVFAVLDRTKSRGDNNLYLLDLRSGGEVLLTPHLSPATFGAGAFSPDGKAVYFSTDMDRGLAAFARVRIGAGGSPGPVELLAAREDAELDEFAITSDGKTAALLWNTGGRSELSFLDLITGTTTAGPVLGVRVARELVFSSDGNLLALTISGPATPTDIWIFDRGTRDLRQLTHSPHAGVDLASLVSPERISFRSHDGLKLSGWLYRAGHAAGTPGPVVLSFHDGPEAGERPVFRADYQALLSEGISVFAPNVRGSAGFGKRFAGLDDGPARLNAIRDIKACAEHMIRTGVADPKRIGIMGASYGGYMAMAGLTEYPKLFAAGVDLYGIVDLETFVEIATPWMAGLLKAEYGDPGTQADMLRALSPIHKIDRVSAPILVLHGANDPIVPPSGSEQVLRELKRRGVPVQYILFPDEGHGFRRTANRIRATTAVAAWFDRYLNR